MKAPVRGSDQQRLGRSHDRGVFWLPWNLMKGKFQSQYVCSVGMNNGGISKPAGTDPFAEDRDLV